MRPTGPHPLRARELTTPHPESLTTRLVPVEVDVKRQIFDVCSSLNNGPSPKGRLRQLCAKDGSAASREFSWLIPKRNKHLNVHAPFIHAYPWLSAQTPSVAKYVDAIVAMTPVVMAASAKLNT